MEKCVWIDWDSLCRVLIGWWVTLNNRPSFVRFFSMWRVTCDTDDWILDKSTMTVPIHVKCGSVSDQCQQRTCSFVGSDRQSWCLDNNPLIIFREEIVSVCAQLVVPFRNFKFSLTFALRRRQLYWTDSYRFVFFSICSLSSSLVIQAWCIMYLELFSYIPLFPFPICEHLATHPYGFSCIKL